MSDKPEKRRILIQLDPDAQASSFDRVVAVDAGVDEIFSYGGVALDQVQGLVHGAIFTRGLADLRFTAIFVGGSDVGVGEEMLRRVRGSFLGPLCVSVMLDANGANTTAAAAVLAARKHVNLAGTTAVVLGGTGPVGQRAARLLGREGATVRLCSRSEQRAGAAAEAINKALGDKRVSPCIAGDEASLKKALGGAAVVIAAGAAGVELLPASVLQAIPSLKVAIDLNAVPPAGVGGVKVMDKGADLGAVKAYGAIGVGGTKMKIHKAAVAGLFEVNNRVFDAEEIFELGKTL